MTQTQSEYFIEKDRLPVELTMVTGEALRGSLFVQPSWRRPSIEFDALALVNHPDAYFPVALSDGTSRLVAKRHVVLIRGRAADERAASDAEGDPARAVIKCTNAEAVEGTLMITRLTPNSRVLDFLNRSTEEFMLLHESDSTVLINRQHVVLVYDATDGE